MNDDIMQALLVLSVLFSVAVVATLLRAVHLRVQRDIDAAGKPTSVTLHIARLQHARLPCEACGSSLEDGELVVWREREGERSQLVHAGCIVRVKHENGMVTGIENYSRPEGVYPEHWLLLTRAEWEAWKTDARPRLAPETS